MANKITNFGMYNNLSNIFMLSSSMKLAYPVCTAAELQVPARLWERWLPKSFDVVTGPAQTMHSCHALNFAWGEHTYMYICILYRGQPLQLLDSQSLSHTCPTVHQCIVYSENNGLMRSAPQLLIRIATHMYSNHVHINLLIHEVFRLLFRIFSFLASWWHKWRWSPSCMHCLSVQRTHKIPINAWAFVFLHATDTSLP